MFHHDALGPPGRAGGIDHIGQIARHNCGSGVGVGHARQRRIGVEAQNLRAVRRQIRRQRRLGDDHRAGRILDVKRDTFGRIAGIHRHISRTRLLNGQRPHHHIQRAPGAKPHQHPRPHAHADQPVRRPVGRRVQRGIAQRLRITHQRHRIRRARHLCLERGMGGQAAVGGKGRLVAGEKRLRPLVCAHGRDIGKPLRRSCLHCRHNRHQPRRNTRSPRQPRGINMDRCGGGRQHRAPDRRAGVGKPDLRHFDAQPPVAQPQIKRKGRIFPRPRQPLGQTRAQIGQHVTARHHNRHPIGKITRRHVGAARREGQPRLAGQLAKGDGQIVQTCLQRKAFPPRRSRGRHRIRETSRLKPGEQLANRRLARRHSCKCAA